MLSDPGPAIVHLVKPEVYAPAGMRSPAHNSSARVQEPSAPGVKSPRRRALGRGWEGKPGSRFGSMLIVSVLVQCFVKKSPSLSPYSKGDSDISFNKNINVSVL